MKNIIYLKDGDLLLRTSDTERPIRQAAVLMDKDTYVLLGYGEAKVVKAKFDTMVAACKNAGATDMMKSLMYAELSDTHLTLEQQAYILKRLVEFTASPFHEDIVKLLTNPGADTIGWLNQQMRDFTLDLYATD